LPHGHSKGRFKTRNRASHDTSSYRFLDVQELILYYTSRKDGLKKMRIKYAVSLWNYYHYADVPSLERIIGYIRRLGYGIEFWGSWKEEKDLYDEVGRKRLKGLVKGMDVSLHGVIGINTFELHKKQIDAAKELGARVIVVHPDNLASGDRANLDIELSRDIVGYANKNKIKIALENGGLSFLINAIEKVKGLGICLDVGHVYFTNDSMKDFLDALKERIIHLHIQDILPKDEDSLPGTGKDHYTPGTGGIPYKDWKLIAKTLKEINFQGTAVFEIQPRNPLQTALLGANFMHRLMGR